MNPVTPINFRGLPAVQLRAHDGDCATVSRHGAHVLSWIPADGDEKLYLSERSEFTAGVPIRGGVPVIFPQFATYGPLPHHGIVRTRDWLIASADAEDGRARATFVCEDSDDTRTVWPHRFVVSISVSVGAHDLAIAMQVDNPGETEMVFNAALHTYVRVRDVRHVELNALYGARYRDRTDRDQWKIDTASTLRFDGEVDRIYVDAPAMVHLCEGSRSLAIESTGFRDLVVWNPWMDKSASLPDLPDDGYLSLVCVEAAAIATPVILRHNERWIGTQKLVATPAQSGGMRGNGVLSRISNDAVRRPCDSRN